MKALMVVSVDLPRPSAAAVVLDAMKPPTIPYFAGQVRVVVEPQASEVTTWLDGDGKTEVSPELPKVLADVAAERRRQVELGWTPAHDDGHSTAELIHQATLRSHQATFPVATQAGMDLRRRRLVQAIAVLVAAVEAMDRRADA